MKPPGNSPTIVNYGNATTPFIGSAPAIEHRIGIGAPTMRAPSMTVAPRMPIIERITPANINAGKVSALARARGLTIATRAMQRGVDTVTGYGHTFFQRISTPLVWNGGPKTTRARNSNYSQK